MGRVEEALSNLGGRVASLGYQQHRASRQQKAIGEVNAYGGVSTVTTVPVRSERLVGRVPRLDREARADVHGTGRTRRCTDTRRGGGRCLTRLLVRKAQAGQFAGRRSTTAAMSSSVYILKPLSLVTLANCTLLASSFSSMTCLSVFKTRVSASVMVRDWRRLGAREGAERGGGLGGAPCDTRSAAPPGRPRSPSRWPWRRSGKRCRWARRERAGALARRSRQ